MSLKCVMCMRKDDTSFIDIKSVVQFTTSTVKVLVDTEVTIPRTVALASGLSKLSKW